MPPTLQVKAKIGSFCSKFEYKKSGMNIIPLILFISLISSKIYIFYQQHWHFLLMPDMLGSLYDTDILVLILI